jgi:hypothetical protein
MLWRITNNFSFAEFVPMVEGSVVAMWLMVVGYVMHFLPRGFNDFSVRALGRLGFIGQWLVIVITIWLVMQCDAMLLLSVSAGGGLPMYAAF